MTAGYGSLGYRIGSYCATGIYGINDSRVHAANEFNACFAAYPGPQVWGYRAQKWFTGAWPSNPPADIQTLARDQGMTVIVVCGGAVNGADRSAMDTFLTSWTGGATPKIPAEQILMMPHQEMGPAKMTVAQYRQMLEYYAPVCHSHGVKVMYNAAGSSSVQNWKDYCPGGGTIPYTVNGDPLCDIVSVDLYGPVHKGKSNLTEVGGVLQGTRADYLKNLYDIANGRPAAQGGPMPFCLPELGSSVIPAEPLDQVWFTDYIHYVRDTLIAQAQAGYPGGPSCWYNCNADNANSNCIGGPATTIHASASGINPSTNPAWQHTGDAADPFPVTAAFAVAAINTPTGPFDQTPGVHGGGAANPKGIGRLWVQTTNGVAHITYAAVDTSVSPPKFTKCAWVEGGTGTLVPGAPVRLYPFTSGDASAADFRVPILADLYAQVNGDGVGAAPSVTTMSLAGAQAGQAYTATIRASGGVAPLALTQTGKPAWASWTDHGDGTATLAGTPADTTGSPFRVAVTVTDSTTPTPQTATRTLTLTVSTAPPAGTGYDLINVWGGGCATAADIKNGKILIGTDTQGIMASASSPLGNDTATVGTGLGVADGRREVSSLLWSNTETNVAYALTRAGLLASTDGGKTWGLRCADTANVYGIGNPVDAADLIPADDHMRTVGRQIVDDVGNATSGPRFWVATYRNGVKWSADHGANFTGTGAGTANFGGQAPGTSYYTTALAQDPDSSWLMYAGTVEHKAAPLGYGGLWKHVAARSAPSTTTRNFDKVTLPAAISSVWDIKVIGGVVYIACGGAGVWACDTNSGGTTWVQISDPAWTCKWMSLDARISGSNHVVVAVASLGGSIAPTGDSAKTQVVQMTLSGTPKTTTVTRAVLVSSATGNVQSTHVPPDNEDWWFTASGNTFYVLGTGTFHNPNIRYDPADPTKIYIVSAMGMWRSVDSGATWTVCNAGMAQFLGRGIATDPTEPGTGLVCSSDWEVLHWAGGGLDGNQIRHWTSDTGWGCDAAFDPFDGTGYWSCGGPTRYGNEGGKVFSRARGAGSATEVGSLGTATGGNVALGLCALRAGTGTAYTSADPKCVIAAVQGNTGTNRGGIYRWTAALGWVKVQAFTSTTAIGYYIPIAHEIGTSDVYVLDSSSGILYHSADFGATWASRLTGLDTNDKTSRSLAVMPGSRGELWVSAKHVLSKITGAHQASPAPVKTTMTLPGGRQAGPCGVRPADRAIFAATADDGAGARMWMSTDGGGSWSEPVTDGSFGANCFNPDHVVFDGYSVVTAGSNVAVTAVIGSPPSSGTIDLVQAANNQVGAAGTWTGYFSQGGAAAPNLAGSTLSVRLALDDCAMTVTPPNANWKLAAESKAGTGAGQARVQHWLYRNAPAGTVGTTSGTGAAFTYSNTGANVRGRIVERKPPAGQVIYVDQAASAAGTAPATSLGPATTALSARQDEELALAMTAAVFSSAPAGQTWPAVSGWTTDTSLAAAVMSWAAYSQQAPGGSETITPTTSTSTGMTSWATALVTLWASPVDITTAASLPAAAAGALYGGADGFTLDAVGGAGDYTWSMWANTLLPDGLALLPGGSLTGAPATPGDYLFALAATDHDGNLAYQWFTLTVTAGITISTTTLPDGEEGAAYPPPGSSAALAGIGGTGALTWTATGLPDGVTLTTGGTFTGTATTAGAYQVVFRATDTVGAYAEQQLTITIQPPVTITTPANQTAIIDAPVSIVLTTNGGLLPVVWQVTSVDGLPAGLDLADDTISGAIADLGNYSWTVGVTDRAGVTATLDMTLVVSAPPAVAAVLDSLVIAGAFELLGAEGGVESDHPACPGAKFVLGNPWQPGSPQPVTDLLAQLALDGERPQGRRASNRTVVIPITVYAPDRTTLAAARETLWQAVDGQTWPLTWARAGGLPLVFDCFRATVSGWEYSPLVDQELVSVMEITCQALPYGKSTDLETIVFAAPSETWSTPAAPVQIDSYTQVSSTTQPGAWSWNPATAVGPSPAPAGGAGSAKWARTWRNRPHYTTVLDAAVDIGQRPKVTFWLGLSTSPSQWHTWHGGKVIADVTLVDAAGVEARVAITRHADCSGVPDSPAWTRMTGSLPAPTAFDSSHVVGYSIKVWNTTDHHDGGRVLQAECYLCGLEASGASYVPQVQPRGAVYHIRGLLGTARAPLNLQLQPKPRTTQTFYDAPVGTDVPWNKGASGFTGGTVRLEGTGTGGGGGGGHDDADRDYDAGGGGGGAGEYACEPEWQIAATDAVTTTVAAGGRGGGKDQDGSAGPDAVIKIAGREVLRAHGGQGGPHGQQNTERWAEGGQGSQNSIHFDGGRGGAAQYGHKSRYEGSGGGSSGGAYAPGNDGGLAYPKSPGSDTYLPGPGGQAVTGGGPGGTGGDGGPGQTPRSGYGGGGGGGDGHAGASGAPGYRGRARITFGVTAGTPMQALVIHKPGPDAPPTLSPMVRVDTAPVNTPNGTVLYPVVSPAATPDRPSSVPARFGGTYRIMACALQQDDGTWWHGTGSRTVTVTVTQYDGLSGGPGGSAPGGPGRATSVSASRAFTPANAPNGMVALGTVTLPARDLAPDQGQVTWAVTIDDSDEADRFGEILLLDVEGSTVFLNTTSQGFENVWIDEPEPDRGLGQVLGSYGDRDSASSVLDDAMVSGPPIYAEPGDSWIMVHSTTSGAPGMFASYQPRYRMDRLR